MCVWEGGAFGVFLAFFVELVLVIFFALYELELSPSSMSAEPNLIQCDAVQAKGFFITPLI